jgi:hypothetical protein
VRANGPNVSTCAERQRDLSCAALIAILMSRASVGERLVGDDQSRQQIGAPTALQAGSYPVIEDCLVRQL